MAVKDPFLRKIIKRLLSDKGSLVGVIIIVIAIIFALGAPLIAPHSPGEIFAGSYKASPLSSSSGGAFFLLGSDDLGRDLFSRLVYGTRVSLGIGLMIVIFASSIGTMLGLLSGYFGGFIDAAVMRLTDVIMSLPSILLAIVVVSILGPGLLNTVIAVGIVALPSFIRIVRSSVIDESSKEYVQAAKSLGAKHPRILFKNIFPNCLGPLIVQASLGLSEGILNTAALGFLGLGAQPPTPEWGTMLADARAYIETAPWLVTLPGLCILVVVLGFNLLGDGLRDALDPKLRR